MGSLLLAKVLSSVNAALDGFLRALHAFHLCWQALNVFESQQDAIQLIIPSA